MAEPATEAASSVLVVRSPLRTEVEIRRPQEAASPRLIVVMGGRDTTPDALYQAAEHHLTAAEQTQVRVALGLEETRAS